MIATLLVTILFAVLAVNVTAFAVGAAGPGSRFDKVAKYAGGLGLAMFLLAILAVLDLASQIWVMRLGYEGWPVFISLLGLGACSVGSAGSLALMWYRHWH